MADMDDGVIVENELRALREENDKLQSALDCSIPIEEHEEKLAAKDAEIARLKQSDREAATYVEAVICMRTNFTGDPPYVGWKGLGRALTEALDERDAKDTEIARLREAMKPFACPKQICCATDEDHYSAHAVLAEEDGK